MATEIRAGVHEITTRHDDNGRRYRVFLFDGDRPTLVDAGPGGTSDALFEALDDLGVEPERLLITHCDGDHVGNVDAIVDRYDVELLAPEDADVGSDAAPDGRFGDGDEVGPFTAVHVPGHAAEQHAFVDETNGIAVLADAVFGADLRGLPAGHFVLPPGVYSEDLNLAEESLAKLLEYDFDVGLVFHGSSVLSGAHERLDRFFNFPGRP